MKVVIVGAGLIGCERIEALQHLKKFYDVEISSVVDVNSETLSKVNNKYNVKTTTSVHEALENKPDWVFIATTNDAVYDVAKLAFERGANVLTEKPLGRTLEECNKIVALKPEHLKLNVGFNYRFFEGISAALKDAKSGKFGDLISINMILAHGNAPGMEKSWHLDPVKRGSVVADLGVHLFDLALQLSPNISLKQTNSWSGFWNTGIIEEAHLLLSDEKSTIYNMQVSFDRWRSIFKFEINGTEGYGIVEGRGRSYGDQTYRVGKRWGWAEDKSKTQAETEQVLIKSNCKNSFINETASLLGFGVDGSQVCSYNEAVKVMNLLNEYNISTGI